MKKQLLPPTADAALRNNTQSQTGSVSEFTFSGSKIMPGIIHAGRVYIPARYRPGEAAALYISQDGMRECEPEVFDRLIAEGAMPVAIGVFVSPGRIQPAAGGDGELTFRCPEYDSLGSAYADFLIDELLPELERQFGFRIAAGPDAHAIGGCSSGGIAAFNAAWERNDFFRRVYLASPSFSAFRGGEAFPVMVRKYETKPIRSFMTVGSEDMRNAAGDWYLEALSMKEALQYAGYDFAFETYPGGKHGAGYGDAVIFERAQRFLWKDYPEKVTAKHLPPRLNDVVWQDRGWETCAAPLPPLPDSLFTPGGKSLLRDGQDASGKLFTDVLFPATSCEGWRFYIADRDDRHVYTMSIDRDGRLVNRNVWGWLHLDDKGCSGTTAICADDADRLYVGTALGVQLIDNTGHNQGILPLPGGKAVRALRLADSALYAEDSTGKRFRRPLKTRAATPGDAPKAPPKIAL